MHIRTRTYKPLALAALAIGVLGSEAAWAQTQVLYVTDSSGYDPPAASDFHAQMRSAGATSSVSVTSLPTSLSAYRVVLVGPRQSGSWSSAEISRLSSYASTAGVTLVIIAEHSGYIGSYTPTNGLLSGMGISSRFFAGVDGGCSETGTVLTSTGYMAGVSAVTLGASGRISLGSGGTALFATGGGTQIAAHSNVVLVGDSNVFGGCGSSAYGTSTKRFWRNLYTGACTPVTWFLDSDGDGYGGSTSTSACTAPGSSWIRTGGDCNDSNSSINPGRTEIVADGVDQNCDARETCYQDADQDAWRTNVTVSSTSISCARSSGLALASVSSVDCDDFDAATFPGAAEIVADGKDQSCNGEEICYRDADSDRWRTDATTVTRSISCPTSEGFALASIPRLDCDDADPVTFPGAAEIIADGKDQSCDDLELCYQDLDADGWRTDLTTATTDISCTGEGLALRTIPGIDCDDLESTTYPGATEVPYDGVDQDCSGLDLCDVDGDGFDAGIGECFGIDCSDEDDLINPFADEVWYDGVDQNCDDWSDFDSDYDGYDSADHERPDGTFGDDCDDDDAQISPEAEEEYYDGVDADCDGWSDYDADRDGHDTAFVRQPDGSIGEDCNDDDPDIYPGAPSLPDGKDNDCDGITDTTDSDNDGLPDELEELLGTDPHDADSDGDGLWDGLEVGEDPENPVDTDGDGVIDALDDDDDGDGIQTATELGDGEAPRDTDGDGTPDYLDEDSDGDGFSDLVEGEVDTDGDGVPDYLDLDSDGDTVLDADELDTDTDEDGADDRVDADDDGDGWSTAVEETWDPRDLDGDGTPNYLDPDSDGDGRNDVDEGSGDDDCDGVANVVDANDADGPCGGDLGVSTFQSGACTGANATSAPAFGLLGLLALVGLRRRRG
jgi:MYXO-CTERM domain-containing protein